MMLHAYGKGVTNGLKNAFRKLDFSVFFRNFEVQSKPHFPLCVMYNFAEKQVVFLYIQKPKTGGFRLPPPGGWTGAGIASPFTIHIRSIYGKEN